MSEKINRVEKLLRDEKQQVAIAQLLRKVQLEEKEKLLLVYELSLVRTRGILVNAPDLLLGLL